MTLYSICSALDLPRDMSVKIAKIGIDWIGNRTFTTYMFAFRVLWRIIWRLHVRHLDA